jgi:hypothetical protein
VAARDLVGRDAEAFGRRRNSGGKKRSSVHSTNLVGTFGHASSGHGETMEASDGWARSFLIASSASSRGTS